MQKFILDVIPIVQLWTLENKSAIDINDQKLKKVLRKLKIEQQLVNKIEGQELNKEWDDDKAKAFDFVIESQKSEGKIGKKGCNKKGGEVTKVWEKENRTEWKKPEVSWDQSKKIWKKYLKKKQKLKLE